MSFELQAVTLIFYMSLPESGWAGDTAHSHEWKVIQLQRTFRTKQFISLTDVRSQHGTAV